MIVVEHECDSCNGSGVYSGFCEPPGVAVVCMGCNGTGLQTSKFRPFDKRKRKDGIKWVFNSRGAFIATGIGPVGGKISYADFLKGKMPK